MITVELHQTVAMQQRLLVPNVIPEQHQEHLGHLVQETIGVEELTALQPDYLIVVFAVTAKAISK